MRFCKEVYILKPSVNTADGFLFTKKAPYLEAKNISLSLKINSSYFSMLACLKIK